MEKLTKRQIREFAKHYIGSQMMLIDGHSVGRISGVVDEDDIGSIVEEINYQGQIILGLRKHIVDPVEIIEHLK